MRLWIFPKFLSVLGTKVLRQSQQLFLYTHSAVGCVQCLAHCGFLIFLSVTVYSQYNYMLPRMLDLGIVRIRFQNGLEFLY